MTPSTRRNRMISDSRVNITRILLTGGPCAGKTTALAAISQDLTQLGYKVLVVPEAATLIMKGGAMIVSSGFTEQQGLLFQKALMKLQISLEDSFVDIGQMVEGTPVVILVDRGLLDGSAYVSQNNWQALLDDLGCNTVMLRDNRYDAVVHLVTAADGAEKFYASLNNEARYESVEEAVSKDRRLREAYLGH
jgi:predicted ATPase